MTREQHQLQRDLVRLSLLGSPIRVEKAIADRQLRDLAQGIRR